MISKFDIINDNKRNHSMAEFKGNEEEYTKLKYKFRPFNKAVYEGFEKFNTRFYSYLLYQWSKRKLENKIFNMWVSCLIVENQYIHRYADVFMFDEKEEEIIEKSKKLFKILNNFYFPDVEVYFFIEDGDDRRDHRPHLLDDVVQMLQKKFLIKYNFCSVIEEEIL